MRSEKEINDRLKKIDFEENKSDEQNYDLCLTCGAPRSNKCNLEHHNVREDTSIIGATEALTWVLEGEPRYSVEELEKIEKSPFWIIESEQDFLWWVKDNPEKVKKILERD